MTHQALLARLKYQKTLFKEIHSKFDYHPDGYFTYKRRASQMLPGDLVGFDIATTGKRQCTVLGRRFQIHTLVYLYHTGRLCDYLDHKSGGFDDRIENLRPATHQLNMYNQKRRIDNTTGYKGVHFNVRWQTYEVGVNANKKKYHIWGIDTVIHAARVRDILAILLHGDFVRLDIPEYVDYYHQCIQYYKLDTSSDLSQRHLAVKQIKDKI